MSGPSIPEIGSRRYFRRMLKRDLHRELLNMTIAVEGKRPEPGSFDGLSRGELAGLAAELFSRLPWNLPPTEKDLGL